MNLLEQAAISEAHCMLMGTVVEKISSAESGLHEAFMSVLRGFEVRKVIFLLYHTCKVYFVYIVDPENLVAIRTRRAEDHSLR